MMLKLCILAVSAVLISMGQVAAEGRLSLRIMESYLPFNTTVTLICGVHGFEMAVGSHYQIIFSASVSQPSRENLEQYAQVEQVGTKCKSIPAKKKRFQAGCSEGTPDEASYTRTYTLNIVPLRPDDPLQGWVCCFNSCTNMKSKAINIVPFKLKLNVSASLIYIPPETRVLLMCVMEPAKDIDGVISFKNGNNLFGTVHQTKDNCTALILKRGYEPHCGEGTHNFMTSEKSYTLTIESMAVQDYAQWGCEQDKYDIKSNLLHLEDKLCNLKCVHGTLKSSICKCDCDKMWTGLDCSKNTCNLRCKHNGTIDSSVCRCNCIGNWAGTECETNKCKLECEHGDFEDENCICNCFEHWTGDKCDVNSAERQTGFTAHTTVATVISCMLPLLAVLLIWMVCYHRFQPKANEEHEVTIYESDLKYFLSTTHSMATVDDQTPQFMVTPDSNEQHTGPSIVIAGVTRN